MRARRPPTTPIPTSLLCAHAGIYHRYDTAYAPKKMWSWDFKQLCMQAGSEYVAFSSPQPSVSPAPGQYAQRVRTRARARGSGVRGRGGDAYMGEKIECVGGGESMSD